MATLDEVVAAVLDSRRYRSVHRATVQRVARAQGIDGMRPAEAIKRTKRALHQIFGAYLPQPPRYERLLAALDEAGDDTQRREVLRRAMAQHASTRERLEHLEEFGAAVVEHLAEPTSVLDVACGLQPLASPWWLPSGVDYHAWDIDVALVAFVGACLTRLGLRPHAAPVDLLDVQRWPDTEVALVLKTLPCLEQQRSGAGEALLAAIPAPRLVVSFPTRSLSGRAKGMRRTYAEGFESLLARRGWAARSFEIGPELIYVVDRVVDCVVDRADSRRASPSA